jgi:hypothetical protein
MTDIRRWCCGPDGRPDFGKMTDFMERHERGSRFDAIGWALFFVWVGVAWLFGFSLGAGLLGVAVITLVMQGIRRIYGVPIEWFWVLVGLGFAVAGLWQWIDIQKPLAPFVFIVIGIAVLLWSIRPRPRDKNPGH